jgi:hypothetical protein
MAAKSEDSAARQPQALVKYEAACRALAECKAVDEVKAWADKAAAMQAYGRMAKDKSLEVDAAEIRLRAERRLGEMLLDQKAGPGLASGARGQLAGKKAGGQALVTHEGQKTAPKLADAGISYDLSSRAQKLAAVPEAEFEAEVGQWRERVSAEGARVTARLEAAGEREQRKAKPAADQDDFDPVAELEKAHAEITKLTAEIEAAEADDLKAEAIKWRRSYEHAQRQQSEAMDRAKQATDREAWTMRQLRRCGKAIGQDDPTKIAPAVEAFVRQYRKEAA